MRRLLKTVFLAAAALIPALACRCADVVEVSRPMIKVGMSPLIRPFSAATFSCHIVNPDARPHRIGLRIYPEGTIESSRNIFSDDVDVPAETVLDYGSEIIFENAERYFLSVYVDGVKGQKADEDIMIKMITGKTVQIAVLNDSYTVSLGAFTIAPGFKGKYNVYHFSARNAPSNWSMYKRVSCLVIVEPEFDRMTCSRYQAILDYVNQGGTVIFAYPPALFKAAQTPLAQLLPVTPVKLRKIHELKPLGRLIPEFNGWTKAVDFMEAVPKDDSVVLLSEDNGLPVFVWSKAGFGSCRFSAIPICENMYEEKTVQLKLLKRHFVQQELYNEPGGFISALDEMTGFSVPGTPVVLRIIAVYVLILLVVHVAGAVLRRHGAAWIISIVAAGVVTVVVLADAGKSVESKGSLFSGIELMTAGTESSPVETYYSVFSTSDRTVDIRSPDADTLLSSISPGDSSYGFVSMAALAGGPQSNFQKVKMVQEGGAQAPSSPLISGRDNGYCAIKGLDLKALTVREFHAFAKGAFGSLPRLEDLPEISYSERGPSMKPWKVPQEFKPEHAFLVFSDGVLPLSINNGELSLEAGSEGMFSTDTTAKRLNDAIHDGARKGTPGIALVEKIGKSIIPPPEKASTQGRRIIMLPALEKLGAETVTVNPEQIPLTAGDSSTRIIISGNKLKKDDVGLYSSSEYLFKFQLPPSFSAIEASEIRVNLKYSNQGGNIDIQPTLALYDPAEEMVEGAQPPKPGSAAAAVKIQGKGRGDGEYVFSGGDVGKALDPVNGSGKLYLIITEKKPVLDAIQKRRINAWSLVKLSVSVKGRLPERVTQFRY